MIVNAVYVTKKAYMEAHSPWIELQEKTPPQLDLPMLTIFAAFSHAFCPRQDPSALYVY